MTGKHFSLVDRLIYNWMDWMLSFHSIVRRINFPVKRFKWKYKNSMNINLFSFKYYSVGVSVLSITSYAFSLYLFKGTWKISVQRAWKFHASEFSDDCWSGIEIVRYDYVFFYFFAHFHETAIRQFRNGLCPIENFLKSRINTYCMTHSKRSLR